MWKNHWVTSDYWGQQILLFIFISFLFSFFLSFNLPLFLSLSLLSLCNSIVFLSFSFPFFFFFQCSLSTLLCCFLPSFPTPPRWSLQILPKMRWSFQYIYILRCLTQIRKGWKAGLSTEAVGMPADEEITRMSLDWLDWRDWAGDEGQTWGWEREWGG